MLSCSFLNCGDLCSPSRERSARVSMSEHSIVVWAPRTSLSRDPGVRLGVSPTLNVPIFFAFFS